jgi:hypothetical protein
VEVGTVDYYQANFGGNKRRKFGAGLETIVKISHLVGLFLTPGATRHKPEG